MPKHFSSGQDEIRTQLSRTKIEPTDFEFIPCVNAVSNIRKKGFFTYDAFYAFFAYTHGQPKCGHKKIAFAFKCFSFFANNGYKNEFLFETKVFTLIWDVVAALITSCDDTWNDGERQRSFFTVHTDTFFTVEVENILHLTRHSKCPLFKHVFLSECDSTKNEDVNKESIASKLIIYFSFLNFYCILQRNKFLSNIFECLILVGQLMR